MIEAGSDIGFSVNISQFSLELYVLERALYVVNILIFLKTATFFF